MYKQVVRTKILYTYISTVHMKYEIHIFFKDLFKLLVKD